MIDIINVTSCKPNSQCESNCKLAKAILGAINARYSLCTDTVM